MTFGFSVKNNGGNVIVSSESYNLVYVGRGSLTGTYVVPAYTAAYYASLGIPTPVLTLYTFSATSTSPIIVPFFNCSGWCCLQFFQIASSSGGTYTWTVQFAALSQPTVYIFQPINPSVTISGTGVLVNNANGGVSYLSTQPHLIPKISTTVNSYGSSLTTVLVPGGALELVYSTSGTYSNNVGSTSLTTPIIHYASPGSACYYDSNDLSEFWFDRVVEYSGSTLSVTWGLSTAYVSIGGGPTLNQGGTSNLVIIAEGAYFT